MVASLRPQSQPRGNLTVLGVTCGDGVSLLLRPSLPRRVPLGGLTRRKYPPQPVRLRADNGRDRHERPY